MKRMESSTAIEWRTGWTLVLAAATGFSFFSLLLGAIALFISPLESQFGWSRAFIASGPSLATIMTAVLSPAVGFLIDRFGSRRIALPGLLLTMAAIAAFSTVSGSERQWIALWVAFGLAAALIKSTAWTAAVVGVFRKSRGLALGLTLSGTAVAQIIVPPLGNWLIDTVGWRAAFVWLAVGWGGVAFVLCLLFFFDLRDRVAGRGPKLTERSIETNRADLPGLSIPQALRNTALWRLAISNFVVMFLAIGLTIHLIEILVEAGVSRTNAAWLTSLSGVAGIAGKLVSGVLLDRFRPNWIGGLTLGMAALAFLFLIDSLASPTLIVVAMIVNGYAAGTNIQIVGYMTAGYAGMKNFGIVYGTMSALLALASGLGPAAAGRVYDVTRSYEWFLMAGVAGCLLGAALILSLPRYPRWEEPRPDPEPAATALAA